MRYQYLLFFLLFSQLFSAQNKSIKKCILEIDSFDLKSDTFSLKDSTIVNSFNHNFKFFLDENPNSAQNLTFKTFQISNKIGFKAGSAQSLFNLATVFLEQKDYEFAKFYFNKALQLYTDLQDQNGILKTSLQLAIVHSKLYEISKALDFSYQIIDSKSQKYPQYVGGAWENLGLIFLEQNKLNESYHYFKKSLTLYQTAKDTLGILSANVNLAQNLIQQKKYNSAFQNLNKGFFINNQLKSELYFAKIYYLYGEAFIGIEKFEEAQKVLKKAYFYYKNILDDNGIAQVFLKDAICYFNLNQNSQALEFIAMALNITKRNDNLVVQSSCYELLSNYYSKNQQYKLALKNERLLHQFRDSIFHLEKNKKITKLQLQYNFDKKQVALDADQKLKEAEIQLEIEQNETVITLVCAGVVLVSVFLAILLYNLRRNSKQRKFIDDQIHTLEYQNHLIEKSIVEKDLLIKEIHHRVKNNLQVVYSLLILQNDSLQSESNLNSLGSSINRIQAMSLIHQNLYQSNDVDEVVFEDYLNDLINGFLQDSPVCRECIAFAPKVGKYTFKIQTSIPLGLIVSELINVSFENKTVSRTIHIHLESLGSDGYKLTYLDSVCIPNFALSEKLQNSISLNLIKILARQLKGDLKLEGSAIEVTFKSIDH